MKIDEVEFETFVTMTYITDEEEEDYEAKLQLNEERNLIRDYYHSNDKNGFDYAYVYPGMNKVLQAAGRLIRSEQDTGMLTLIDDRFLTDKYRSLFPEMWSQFKIINSYKDIVT